jgi:hypothetical protein
VAWRSYLVTYDCVTYNRYLETLRTHEFGQYSIWLFLPAANRIFTVRASLHTHKGSLLLTAAPVGQEPSLHQQKGH